MLEELPVNLRIDRANPAIRVDLEDRHTRHLFADQPRRGRRLRGRDPDDETRRSNSGESHFPLLSTSTTALKAGFGWR